MDKSIDQSINRTIERNKLEKSTWKKIENNTF